MSHPTASRPLGPRPCTRFSMVGCPSNVTAVHEGLSANEIIHAFSFKNIRPSTSVVEILLPSDQTKQSGSVDITRDLYDSNICSDRIDIDSINNIDNNNNNINNDESDESDEDAVDELLQLMNNSTNTLDIIDDNNSENNLENENILEIKNEAIKPDTDIMEDITDTVGTFRSRRRRHDIDTLEDPLQVLLALLPYPPNGYGECIDTVVVEDIMREIAKMRLAPPLKS
eukprot:GHVR01024731.1.p1 GENE.GHVR01024731.1~~GHVR01024731.1.p1  ORF type:complete len:242 (+),score=78.59 GHVR01024731.1:43-726(+)